MVDSIMVYDFYIFVDSTFLLQKMKPELKNL